MAPTRSCNTFRGARIGFSRSLSLTAISETVEMKIDPLVATTFSQFEARQALELSANGGLEGENVLKSV
jgi:hypothetical protein